MKLEENEGRIIAYHVLCNQKDGKTAEIEKEMEEQKSRFEAEREAWQKKEKQLESKLAEANNTIDSLEEKSENESMEYEKGKEEMKNIHKMELNELNTKITELSENVGALEKTVQAKDIEISALKTKAETLDGIQKLLPGSVPSKETVVTPKKGCVHNDVETHNKENTGEKSEVVTAEEANRKPIRKRRGEKTKSGDKEQPKL
ncbi:hypothetical protein CAEBREN_05539 [Caenorhabditis brenneri]|uniref:Uncharacterized protein n=1 Tax=Caenorhabditis brenneri TaxID=135651 RepID=G0P3A1_CAEBE|nr:hypothetical protein CAEBREN_05539 [Caenorhabditis brenneri]